MRTGVQSGKVFHRPKVGKQVRVLYEPAKPAVAHIDSVGVRYTGLVFSVAGLGFFALAVAGLVLSPGPPYAMTAKLLLSIVSLPSPDKNPNRRSRPAEVNGSAAQPCCSSIFS